MINKIKKILLIIFVAIVFTGCAATANINMEYDGSITETIDITAPNSDIKYGDKSIKESLDLFLEKYETVLKVGKYDAITNVNENSSGVKISRSYKDVCSFVNGTIFSKYVYQKLNCIENNDFYEIKNDGTEKNPYAYDPWFYPDEINIKLTLPVEALENNADEVNKNTYIWKYDSNTNNKDFYLKISKSKLKEHEEKHLNSLKTKKVVKTGALIVGVIAVFIVIIFVIKILYKKHQENKL